MWKGTYLLKKTDDVGAVAGWDRHSADKDWRPLVSMGDCGIDSMASSRREESSSV